MKRWTKIILICIITVILLVFPPTRAIILFILPLGIGIDDLIVMTMIAVVLIVIFYKAITSGALSVAIWFCELIGADSEAIEALNQVKNKFNK